MKNILLLVLIVLASCKKEEVKAKAEYTAHFEMVAPLKNDFCPAALQLALDRETVRHIESDASGGRQYIHCRECNIGVYSRRQDSEEMQCSYCEKPYNNQQ